MPRSSYAAVAFTFLLSSFAEAQPSTCDPEFLKPASYRLSTEAQALNVTRPRNQWWDAFDFSLREYQDSLTDLNEGALTIAERALDIDPRNQLAKSQLARQLVIIGGDPQRARSEIATLFAEGGALAWTATLYDVDAKAYFLMGFDRKGITVYRFGEAAPNFPRHLGMPKFPGPEAIGLWRAWGGCFDTLNAEAFVPWGDVREIAAGNFVIWFRFNTRVTVTSDNRKKKTLKEFKVALHGAMATVDYRQTPRSGDDDRWYEDTRTYTGIGKGPATYQDRIRLALVAEIDPQGRIKLPKQKTGAGW